MAGQEAAQQTALTPNTTGTVLPRPAPTVTPPLPPTAQAAKPHTRIPCPDPWFSEISEQTAKTGHDWPRIYPKTPSTPTAPQPRSQPQQETPGVSNTQPPYTAPAASPQPDNQRLGWYKQTFSCRWCGTEKEYQGHGSWPYTQAIQDGWNKPTSKPWAGRASCRACTTKYYSSTAAAHDTPLPTPTPASPQPASLFPW